MKIKKIFSLITYITAYRIIAISSIIFMIGIIIYAIFFKPDATVKSFIVFMATLGLFVTISLLSVVNSFERQEIKIFRKEKKNE